MTIVGHTIIFIVIVISVVSIVRIVMIRATITIASISSSCKVVPADLSV